jgi:flagellar assembly protein FliH
MAIIKSGSRDSEKIQVFSYLESLDEGLPSSSGQAFSLSYPLGAEAPGIKEEPFPLETPPPALDVALIEKTAYENGFRQGEKAGMEIAEKKVEAIMRRYSDSLLELGRLRSDLYAQVEREVVRLSLEVAKKIVHREIQADKQVIQTLVKVALSHVAEKSAVTIHLHPIDYNFVLEHKTELAQSEHGVREIVLLADRSIERGGCLIKTECGDIDARIEEKFREIEQGFFEEPE